MFNLIVAVAENNVIGLEGRIPWKLLPDQLNFKALTSGSVLIMGRKTYESLKINLEDRKIIVMTKQLGYKGKSDNVTSASSKAHVLELVKGKTEIFVAGGAEIYKLFLDEVEKVYLTKIHSSFRGDKFFPILDPEQWQLTKSSVILNYKDIKFSYLEYVKTASSKV